MDPENQVQPDMKTEEPVNPESTEVKEEEAPEIPKEEENIEDNPENPSQEEEKKGGEEQKEDIKEEEEKEEEEEEKEAEMEEEKKTEELAEKKDTIEVNGNGRARNQERQRERNLDPTIVPRNPRYFTHDIRGVDAAEVVPLPEPRKKKSDGEWKHDRFDLPPRPARRGNGKKQHRDKNGKRAENETSMNAKEIQEKNEAILEEDEKEEGGNDQAIVPQASEQDRRVSTGVAVQKCYICNQIGHNARDCPNMENENMNDIEEEGEGEGEREQRGEGEESTPVHFVATRRSRVLSQDNQDNQESQEGQEGQEGHEGQGTQAEQARQGGGRGKGRARGKMVNGSQAPIQPLTQAEHQSQSHQQRGGRNRSGPLGTHESTVQPKKGQSQQGQQQGQERRTGRLREIIPLPPQSEEQAVGEGMQEQPQLQPTKKRLTPRRQIVNESGTFTVTTTVPNAANAANAANVGMSRNGNGREKDGRRGGQRDRPQVTQVQSVQRATLPPHPKPRRGSIPATTNMNSTPYRQRQVQTQTQEPVQVPERGYMGRRQSAGRSEYSSSSSSAATTTTYTQTGRQGGYNATHGQQRGGRTLPRGLNGEKEQPRGRPSRDLNRMSVQNERNGRGRERERGEGEEGMLMERSSGIATSRVRGDHHYEQSISRSPLGATAPAYEPRDPAMFMPNGYVMQPQMVQPQMVQTQVVQPPMVQTQVMQPQMMQPQVVYMGVPEQNYQQVMVYPPYMYSNMQQM